MHSINPSLISSFRKQQVYIAIKILQHDTNKGFCLFAPSFSFFPLIPKQQFDSVPLSYFDADNVCFVFREKKNFFFEQADN